MTPKYFTSGQVARKLHISISTLKRWLSHAEVNIKEYRNCNGWRLFTNEDIDELRKFKKFTKKNGRNFKETTLIPIEVIGK
jgi:DNA-binding transcriptional MerR regulator